MKINSLRNTEGHFNSRRIRYILHNIYTIFAMNFLTSIMLKMKILTAGTSLLRPSPETIFQLVSIYHSVSFFAKFGIGSVIHICFWEWKIYLICLVLAILENIIIDYNWL